MLDTTKTGLPNYLTFLHCGNKNHHKTVQRRFYGLYVFHIIFGKRNMVPE